MNARPNIFPRGYVIGRYGPGLAALFAIVLIRVSVAQTALDTDRLEAEIAALSGRYADALSAFYFERDYRSVWADAAGVLPAGRALLDALENARNDGLDPADYRAAVAGRVEAREVALADAFLRLGHDLTRGRVDPARVHHDWDAMRRPFDAAAALRQAAAYGPAHVLEVARPPYGAYARLSHALVRYRAIDEAGGWPAIPDGPSVHPGDSSFVVHILRTRLLAEGYDVGIAGNGDLYDWSLEQAVRVAQGRLGLEVDGIVGPATRGALNVPAAARVRQIELNMERWRWMPADPGTRYIHINAAGMTLELVKGGEPILMLRTIVGTPGNPTPGFSSHITSAVLSPYWYVPTSIARNEVWPRVRRDEGYLARNHMVVLPGGRIRQSPGPDNPLGPVKFMFESRFGVRLHGAANPALFDTWRRAFSHGCIRIETPLVLAERLLEGTGWDAARIDEAVTRGRELSVPLVAPVPIHVAYWTAWVTPEGDVHFRADLYGRDLALERVLAERRSFAEAASRPPLPLE